jgi:hypothetical protein
VRNAIGVRQMEIRKSEPIVPARSRPQVKIPIAKLINCECLGRDQIPSEMIEAGGETH